jgi:hypothetical protein
MTIDPKIRTLLQDLKRRLRNRFGDRLEGICSAAEHAAMPDQRAMWTWRSS